MKNHLKRIAAPKTWILARWENKFVVRPNAGGHPLELGLPLGIVLRDHLKFASTMNEVKKIIDEKEILVDGKRYKDHRAVIGLFDVLSIPAIKKHYRVVLDVKGRIIVLEVPASESAMKVCKIIGKTALPGGKMQFNLHDGNNILAAKQAKVGDSFVVALPSLDVKEVLPLKEGCTIFLARGKHGGEMGVLKEIKGKEARYMTDGQEIETAKEYLFVVGNKNTLMTLR